MPGFLASNFALTSSKPAVSPSLPPQKAKVRVPDTARLPAFYPAAPPAPTGPGVEVQAARVAAAAVANSPVRTPLRAIAFDTVVDLVTKNVTISEKET